jgi:hypothetical protein
MFLLQVLSMSLSHYPMPLHHEHCASDANATWTNPGGISEGLTNCIKNFVSALFKREDPCSLIDPPLAGITRLEMTILYPGTLPKEPRKVGLPSHDLPRGDLNDRYGFNRAEWLLPRGYEQRDDEVRLVFVHGGSAAIQATGPCYAGFTTRLANWTDLPVMAFNYPTDPVVPWPQNLWYVLRHVGHALHNGPHRGGKARQLILVADSEGTLVLTQALISLQSPTLRELLGWSHLFPEQLISWVYISILERISPTQHLPRSTPTLSMPDIPPAFLSPHIPLTVPSQVGGVVLSSVVVDVACETPSFCHPRIKLL